MSSTSAYAALVACPEPGFVNEPNAKVEDPTGTLTASFACQYLTPPDSSNTASIANINAANFFGSDDWESNGQDQIGPGGQSGTWTIANPDFATYHYGIFFKDGSDTNLVGFVFNEQYASGVWSSPFTEPPFDFNNGQTKDVSHYTIARVEATSCPGCGPDPQIIVPEPGSLAVGRRVAGRLGRHPPSSQSRSGRVSTTELRRAPTPPERAAGLPFLRIGFQPGRPSHE
jgi:hypothetical protein